VARLPFDQVQQYQRQFDAAEDAFAPPAAVAFRSAPAATMAAVGTVAMVAMAVSVRGMVLTVAASCAIVIDVARMSMGERVRAEFVCVRMMSAVAVCL
jgi:hypothetical protein